MVKFDPKIVVKCNPKIVDQFHFTVEILFTVNNKKMPTIPNPNSNSNSNPNPKSKTENIRKISPEFTSEFLKIVDLVTDKR